MMRCPARVAAKTDVHAKHSWSRTARPHRHVLTNAAAQQGTYREGHERSTRGHAAPRLHPLPTPTAVSLWDRFIRRPIPGTKFSLPFLVTATAVTAVTAGRCDSLCCKTRGKEPRQVLVAKSRKGGPATVRAAILGTITRNAARERTPRTSRRRGRWRMRPLLRPDSLPG